MDLSALQILMKTPLGKILESTNQVFWISSADLEQTLYISSTYEKVWGAEIASLYECPEFFTNCIYPDDKERVLAAREGLLKNGVMDEEYQVNLLDGSTKWVHNRAFRYEDAPDGDKYVVSIAEEITERRFSSIQAEKALREREEKFQQFAHHAEIVFWVCELDISKFHYISPGYEKIWGRPCADIYSYPLSFLESIHPDDLKRVIAAAIGENACNMDEEYRIIRPDGTMRWVRDRTFPIYDEQGKLFRMAGVAKDITSRKLAEEESLKTIQRERELSEAKSNFIATTSHEIRTPLATIQSSCDMLHYYTQQLSEEKKEKHFHKIETAIKRITDIVQDVLLLSEAEANALQFQPSLVDVVKLCQNIVTNITDKNENKNRIKLSVNSVNIQAYLDSKLVTHVSNNLLENALKYSPLDSKVIFHIDSTERGIIFNIKDKGIGIPSEELPYIFDSFRRAKNVATISGTGLGLSIVKQCIEIHQGEILVDSILGEGTTVRVMFPRSQKSHLPFPIDLCNSQQCSGLFQ